MLYVIHKYCLEKKCTCMSIVCDGHPVLRSFIVSYVDEVREVILDYGFRRHDVDRGLEGVSASRIVDAPLTRTWETRSSHDACIPDANQNWSSHIIPTGCIVFRAEFDPPPPH